MGRRKRVTTILRKFAIAAISAAVILIDLGGGGDEPQGSLRSVYCFIAVIGGSVFPAQVRRSVSFITSDDMSIAAI